MNLEERIKELERLVAEQQQFIQSLQRGYSIPREFDQAMRERLLGNSSEISDGGDGGSVNVSVYNSFNVDVPVVSGKRTLVVDGVSYNFLYQ